MIQHVALEIRAGELERSLEFWAIVGFRQVPAPDPVAGYVSWVERAGTQIHLFQVDEPVVPARGHVAVVAPELEATLARLREAGFEVRPKRELWGARRALATAPGGHGVELMAAPPPS